MDKPRVLYRRVLRLYDVADFDGQEIPTIFLVKPNELRYWLRSVALQDADQVAADMLLWSRRIPLLRSRQHIRDS